MKLKWTMIIVMLVAMLLHDAHGLTSDGFPITLQMQLTLYKEGELVNADQDTLRIKIIYPTDVSRTVLWEKAFVLKSIVNGQVNLTLNGEDDNNQLLVADMFDREGIFIEVALGGNVIRHDLVSQPYVVKSRISDHAHSTRSIQGIQVEKVDVLQDGDILMIKDGKWVPMGEDDGIGNILNPQDEIETLGDLGDVTVSEPVEGQALGYNGYEWVSMVDQKLSSEDVERFAENAGFIKEISRDAMAVGEYEQIRGIGGKISVDPLIHFSENVAIGGGLNVGGGIGAPGAPVPTMTISELILMGGKSPIVLHQSEGKLSVSHPIRIEGKQGHLLSGNGEAGRLGIYKSQDEIMMDNELLWDNERMQLGIGQLTNRPEMKLNVSGSTRVNGDFMVRDNLIELPTFVKRVNLQPVAFSGNYIDLLNRPNLNDYVSNQGFSNTIDLEYVRKPNTLAEIERRINDFNATKLPTIFDDKLAPYDPADKQDAALKDRLSGYLTIAESAMFVTHNGLNEQLADYATTETIQSELLLPYILKDDVAKVGTTGSYRDIVDWPNVLYSSDYDRDKATFYQDFATKNEIVRLTSKEFNRVSGDIMADVSADFVTKQQLIDKEYAKQNDVTNLSVVARSGEYTDVIGVPDISEFMPISNAADTFIDSAELRVRLSSYLKISELSAVGKTGRFADVIGAPNMADYQRVDDMGGFVLKSNYDAEMLTVQKVGSDTTLNADGLLTEEQFTSDLANYAAKDTLSAVATSGQYSDLLGTEAVIMDGDLSATLTNYLTKTRLQSERDSIDATYFDDAELTQKLNATKTAIEAHRTQQLNDNYYTTDQANAKIDADIEAHKNGAMQTTIDGMVAPVVQTAGSGKLSDILDPYVSNSELNNEIFDELAKLVTDSTYESDKGQFATVEKVNSKIPAGLIIMWQGTTAPEGWALCNGSNGTPDLRGRFIVGYGGEYSINQTGGEATFTLSETEMPVHNHTASSDDGSSSNSFLRSHMHAGASSIDKEQTHGHTGKVSIGGGLHGHSVSLGKNGSPHTHGGQTNRVTDSHGHGASNYDGNRAHVNLYTSKGTMVGNDYDGKSGQHTSIQRDDGDGGSLQTGDGGGHAHGVTFAETSHGHDDYYSGVNKSDHSHTMTVPNSHEVDFLHPHSLSNSDGSKDSFSHSHYLTFDLVNLSHLHTITLDTTGISSTIDNRPAFYTLAYIMKK